MALDTPLYEVCRGCEGTLDGLSAMMDGICDAPSKTDSCYERLSRWYYDKGVELKAVLDDPGSLVLIDAWLEQGAP